MTRFYNLRLTNGLLCSLGALLTLFAFLVGTFVVSLNTLDRDFKELAQQGNVLAATAEITRSFSKIEGRTRKFVSLSSPETMSEAVTAYHEATDLIGHRQETLRDPEELDRLNDARKHIDAYWENFLQLAEERNTQNDIYSDALGNFETLDEDIRRLEHEVMAAGADILSRDLEEINSIAVAAEHTFREMAHAQTGTTIVFASAATVAGLLIGFTTAFSLGPLMSRPVVPQVQTMQDLMNNRRDVKIDAFRGRDKTAEMPGLITVVHDGLDAGQKLLDEQAAIEETATRRQQELDQMIGVFDNTIRVIFQRISRSSSDMTASAGSRTESSAITVDQIEKLHSELEHRLRQAA